MPDKPTPSRTMYRVRSAGGMTAVLLGFGCYLLSDLFDGGFGRGFFQGATIALMVFGAYLIGASLWFGRRGAEQLDEGSHWLPSRDSAQPARENDDS